MDLKEIIKGKIRTYIDKIYFHNPKAESILKTKNDKYSEVTNVFIQGLI